jgi:methyl-accepting chemotaxis protein
MEHVNATTQQNASASEELSATAEELSAQAAQLQELMGFFQVERARDSSSPAPRQHTTHVRRREATYSY